MAQFSMRIAGYTALVHSLFESTRDYCRDYLTESTPDFSITVTREDLSFEQEFLRREAMEEGFRPRVFTDPFLERAAIQRAFGEYLLDRDVVLLHGSLVAADGVGYFFAARSGTGKSTHTRLWKQLLADRAVIVNDDKPFFAVTKNGILACGAPWSGKHGLHQNLCVRLGGICLLERGEENRIEKASKEALLPMLLGQGGRPLDETRLPRYEALIRHLLERVPLWRMECNKDLSAAVLAYRTMSQMDILR